MKMDPAFPGRLCLSVVALALTCSTVFGEIVLIESRTGSGTAGGITPNPPYLEGAGSWSGSGSHTTAIGTTTNIGSRYAFGGTPVLTLTPTLISGNTYFMELSHISGNASLNILVNIAYTGCTGTATDTTNFNSAVASPNWERVGTITVNEGVTQPMITFTYTNGTLGATGGRWYSDAFRFVNLAEPCVTALPELTRVNGPLAAGQTFVDVPDVSALATAVNVYTNGVLAGQKTSGVTGGVNQVVLGPLIKSTMVTVTQTDINGVESCRPTVGISVGGGPNPALRVALSIRQNTSLTGPIGNTNQGTSSTIIKFIPATNLVAGGTTAPLGSRVVYPSNQWQTVTILRGPDPASPTDPSFLWNGTDATNPNQLKGNFGVLDAIAFSMEEADTGPYAIYIDNVRNGNVVIQDFESANVGAAAVGFNQPSFSGTTDDYLLSHPGTIFPDIAVVTNDTADAGAQSLFASWQFKDTSAINWLRFVAQGSDTPFPQLDLRLPISFSMLLLPVGQVPAPFAPQILADPQNQTVLEGGSATFSFNFRASGPVTYQWQLNGNALMDATSRTLTLTNLQPTQAGNYSVIVSNAAGSATSGNAVLTVTPVPRTAVMNPLWQLAPGDRSYLATDNNQRGIAYHPVTGNLLLISRTGSNAVYVLDGNTGATLHTLDMDTNVVNGGTLALNMIGVTAEGLVYAGNVTADGTDPSNPFKLYVWTDDQPGSPPSLAWSGDPGRLPGGAGSLTNRWGDTMAVRSGPSGPEVLIGSRSGTAVAIIYPEDPLDAKVVFDVTDASPGNFGWGIAWGEGDRIWGKGTAGDALRHVLLDMNTGTPSVLETFPDPPTLRAIGVDVGRKLLAGVSIDNPDNLRLYDISDLSSPLLHVDTEFFPTDNANGNGTGSVAFGPDRVYALNSNNGILAMTLDTGCIPNRLKIERSGTDVVLSWTRADHRLQGAETLGTSGSPPTWNNIAGASPVNVSAASGIKFFRLVCP